MFQRFLRFSLVNLFLILALGGAYAQCPDTQPRIAGPAVVSNGQTGVIYETPDIPGHTFSWTVTGGTIGSGPGTHQITVNWGAVGTGTVTVTETNVALGCNSSYILTVAIQPLLISYFYYTYDPGQSCYYNVILFHDTSVADPARPVVAWDWDFGDPASGAANFSTLQNPTHAFVPPFNTTHTVRLIITNSEGMRDTIYDYIYVNPDQYKPHARIDAAIPTCAYQPVQFSSLSSWTPAGSEPIIHWSWNFGDPASGAGNDTSELQNPTHIFSAPGTYWVTLLITNRLYCTHDTTIQVIIPQTVPDAQYTFSAPTCANNPVYFTDASTFPVGLDIVTWIWNYGDGSPLEIINAPATPNSVHIFPGTGPYTVWLTVINSIGCRDSISWSVRPDPSPIADFRYEPACIGDVVQFENLTSLNGGPPVNSYFWDFDDPAPGMSTSTAIDPSHTFTQVGLYDVMLVATNTTGCPDTIVKTLQVFPIPAVNYTWNLGSQNNLIEFQVVPPTPLPMIGNMVNWNFGDGQFGYGQSVSHIYPAPGSYLVTCTVTDTIGCSNDTAMWVDVPSVPVAFFSSTSPVCDGQEVCFTDLSNANTPPGPFGWITTWIWNYGDGSPNDTIYFPDPNVNPCHLYTSIDTFLVTLTVIDNYGYIDDYSAEVYILPNPAANFSFSVGCEDQIVQFTDQSFANGGGNIIEWYWDFADPGSGINNTSQLQNPTHIFNYGDSCYNVRLIVVNFNDCRDTIYHSVCILPHPPTAFSYDTACVNELVTFTTDPTFMDYAAIATWSWDFGDGTPLGTDPITTQHLYTNAGFYRVTLTVTDTSGCMNTAIDTIEVHPLPVINFTWDAPNCQNTIVQFTDLSYIPTGFTGYKAKWVWEYGDGQVDTIYFPGSPNVQHLYTTPAIQFSVRLTVWSNDSCYDYAEKILDLIPAPIADFSYSTVNCEDQTVNFTDLSQPNGGGNIVTWSWDFGDPLSGINNSSSLPNPSHVYNTAGSYIVRLIVENTSNCVDTVTDTIQINLKPVAQFIADTACFGTPTNFTDQSLPQAFSIITYDWDFGDGSPHQSVPNPQHLYSTYGIFNVTLTITNSNGCVHDTTIQVLVNPLPVAEFSWSAPNCQGAAVDFTDLSSTVPGYLGQIVRWFWEFGDGSTQNILLPNSPNVSHLYTTAALNFTVTLTVWTADSCQHTRSHQITLTPAPAANFTFPATSCAEQLVQFTDQSQENGGGSIVSWYWDFDDPPSGLNNNSFAQNPMHAFTAAGIYDVVLIVGNANGCSDTISKPVTIAARPSASFSADTACLGSVTTFTDLSTPSGGIGSWSWQFGDGGISSAQNPQHQYGSAGIFSVTLTVTTTTGCVNDTTIQVLVLDAAVAAFSYQTPACAGTAVQFFDQSNTSHGYITTWVWDFGDGNTQTINYPANPDVTHIYASGDNFNVVLTITTSDGCTGVKTNMVTIISNPMANFSFPGTFCSQSPVQFTDQSQENGGGTLTNWDWNFGDPGSGANNTSTLQNPIHFFSGPGPFTVTLIVTNINGCKDTTQNTSVDPFAAPVASFTFDTACFGGVTQFTDASTPVEGNIIAWEWNFGDPGSGSLNTSTLQNPTHVFTGTGVYNVTLVVTTSNTCESDTVIPVYVNPAPVAMFEANESCVGTPTQFTDLSIAPGSMITSWYWDFGDGSGTSTQQNPTYTYTTWGTYNVLLIVTNLANCVDSIIIPVTARPTPTAAFNYTSFHCPAGQVNFQDMSQGNMAAIVDRLWIFEPGSMSSDPNPTYTYGITDTTYLVTLIVTDNYGCMDTIVDSVFVEAGFSFTFSFDTVCYGVATQFQAINLAPGDTLYSTAWNFGDPGSGPYNISYDYNPTHLFSEPGVFTVKLKAWNSDNCTDSVFRYVQVYDLPEPDFSFLSEPCDSVIHLLDETLPGIGNIQQWEWHFGDGTPPLIITGMPSGDTSHIYSTVGQFNVTLITTNSRGCVDSVTNVVERYPCISASFDPNSSNLCSNVPITFTDNSIPVSRISEWYWDFNDGNDTTYYTYSQNITHSFLNMGTYLVKLTITAVVNGVSFQDSTLRMITIHPTPEPYFESPNSCLELAVQFADTSTTFGEPVTSWYWNFGDPGSGTADTSTFPNPSHLYGTPGSYQVQMKVENQYGCEDSLTKVIRIFDLPQAAFTNTVACEGDATYFTDQSVTSDTALGAWYWNFGVPSLVLDTSTLQNPSYIYPAIGNYTVQLIVQDLYGCMDTIDSTVTVSVTPLSNFKIIDNVDGMTGKIQLQNESVNATGYWWDFGNGRTSEEENPTVTYTEDGTYTIMLISMNEYGCLDTTYYEYEVLFKGLYVPNAFAPTSNNLGVMLFKPIGINLKKYIVQVFNNWGELLWESTLLDSDGRPVEGWDGKYNGILMPQGTYMWKISATYIDDSPWNGSDIGKGEISKMGTVTLIR